MMELYPRGKRLYVLREAARSIANCIFHDNIKIAQEEHLERLLYEDFPNGEEE